MNSAKKIMKNNGLQKQDKRTEEAKKTSQKNKILIIIGIVVIIGCFFVVWYTQMRPREILQVEGVSGQGKDTVYFTDAMYDIYSVESQYNNGIYQQIYGKSYWETEDVDGKGNDGRTAAKKTVMSTIKQREVMYLEAMANKLSLSDEEKKTVTDKVKTTRDGLSDGQKSMKGLDESSLQAVLEKQLLADKYKSGVISALNIDEEGLKAKVSKKDFRQYTLQYYTFSKKDMQSAATAKSESDVKNKDDAAIKKGKEDLEALLKKAKTAKDFTTLITDSDKDNKDDKTEITYSTKDLLEKDKDFLDDKALKTIKAMKNDEISDVIETDDGFYVIKMVNNNDSKAYDEECKRVVSEEQEKQFNAKYKDEIAPKYNIVVQDYWKRVNAEENSNTLKMGYITADSQN